MSGRHFRKDLGLTIGLDSDLNARDGRQGLQRVQSVAKA